MLKLLLELLLEFFQLMFGTLIGLLGAHVSFAAVRIFLNPIERMPYVEWLLVLAGSLMLFTSYHVIKRVPGFSKPW